MSTQATPFTATPTPLQEAIVAALDTQSCSPRWIVDAAPLNIDVHEPCENDRAHGPAIVYGGPCDGACLACAIQAIAREHRDPAGSDSMALSVLRVTWGMTFRSERSNDA